MLRSSDWQFVAICTSCVISDRCLVSWILDKIAIFTTVRSPYVGLYVIVAVTPSKWRDVWFYKYRMMGLTNVVKCLVIVFRRFGTNVANRQTDI